MCGECNWPEEKKDKEKDVSPKKDVQEWGFLVDQYISESEKKGTNSKRRKNAQKPPFLHFFT